MDAKLLNVVLTSDTHRGFDKNTDIIHRKFLDRIAAANPDVVLHVGDWAANKQEHFQKSMRQFRKHLPQPIQILTVRGNHDFWDYPNPRNYERIMELHKMWFEEFGIRHLDRPVIRGNVIFLGFDGWYYHSDPPTNDAENMFRVHEGQDPHRFLNRKAHDDLGRVLDFDTTGKKVVGATHFPPFTENYSYIKFCANPSYFSFLTEKCDVLCVGHSHQPCDYVHGKCRVINAGCGKNETFGYNSPQFVLFQI